jgi:hypothetical protein
MDRLAEFPPAEVGRTGLKLISCRGWAPRHECARCGAQQGGRRQRELARDFPAEAAARLKGEHCDSVECSGDGNIVGSGENMVAHK